MAARAQLDGNGAALAIVTGDPQHGGKAPRAAGVALLVHRPEVGGEREAERIGALEEAAALSVPAPLPHLLGIGPRLGQPGERVLLRPLLLRRLLGDRGVDHDQQQDEETAPRPRGPHQKGRAGPLPAPVRSRAAATSSRSASVNSKSAAGSHPSICEGRRAPTIAPVTPGQASVQATATAPTLVPWRWAIGPSAAARPRLRSRRSPLNSGERDRQSSAGRRAARARVNVPLSRPACIGLYTIAPVPCAAHHRSSAAAACRVIAEKGGCSVSTWPRRSAASSCETSWFDRPTERTLPSAFRSRRVCQ